MQINHKLGVFLAAPFVLLTLSATNVHADNTQSSNVSPTTSSLVTGFNSDISSSSDVQTAVSSANTASSASEADSANSAIAASASLNQANSTASSAAVPTETTVNSTSTVTANAASTSPDSNQSANGISNTESFSTQTLNTEAQAEAALGYSPFITSLYVTNYTPQQVNNASYIHDYFINQGWTPNAIAGMLGNFVTESGINPDLYEYGGGGGYGLAQWPASSVQSWCKNNGYDYRCLQGQCAYIQYQMTHGLQYYPSSYSRMTANEYMHSYASAYTLGMIWLNNFERPTVRNQPARGQQAQYWYQYFQTHGSSAPVNQNPNPNPTPSNSSTMSQRGTFRVAYGLNVRQAPSTSATIMATYSGGQSFTYDSKVEANGYLWVSYMSYSGARRYVAIKNLSTGQTYGYDSNNFSFNGTSIQTPTAPTNPVTPQGNKAQQIVSLARQQLGKPYVWGATGPNSFDCSGLVQYVYRQVGINLPRTANAQSGMGYAVSLNNLQAGDLLFWTNGRTAYHVAIYTGNGNMLFAPQPGQTVKEEPMRYWMPAFARRVL